MADSIFSQSIHLWLFKFHTWFLQGLCFHVMPCSFQLVSNFLLKNAFFGDRYFYVPVIYNGGGGGHIASPLSVRLYVPSRTVHTKNGFRVISLEYIGVLDSYFIHRYIIIKYRSSSFTDKIHRLLSELWPMISE